MNGGSKFAIGISLALAFLAGAASTAPAAPSRAVAQTPMIRPVADFGDIPLSFAVGAAGDVFVAGGTESSRFPVKTPYDPSLGGPSDAVLAGFSASGRTLAFSTYLGGMKNEEAFGLRLDSAGDVYVYGKTESKNYPLKLAFDSFYSDFRGAEEGFITRFRRR